MTWIGGHHTSVMEALLCSKIVPNPFRDSDSGASKLENKLNFASSMSYFTKKRGFLSYNILDIKGLDVLGEILNHRLCIENMRIRVCIDGHCTITINVHGHTISTSFLSNSMMQIFVA